MEYEFFLGFVREVSIDVESFADSIETMELVECGNPIRIIPGVEEEFYGLR